jgi:hypothetical protein
MEHFFSAQDHCGNEFKDRNVRVYRYTAKGDSIKDNKTVVCKEVEVIRK